MRSLRTLRDPQRDWLKLFEWLKFLIGWQHANFCLLSLHDSRGNMEV
jgi:hypothetical protein